MAYAAWSVSFGEQPSAAKWNILGTNDATFDALIGSGTAWTSWTPTWTNLTTGNATISSKYQVLGKNLFYRVTLTFGTTTSISGSVSFSLPVNINSGYTSTADMAIIGNARYSQPAVGNAEGFVYATTSDQTKAQLSVSSAAGTYLARTTLTASIPFAWATNGMIILTGMYETA